jgi:hypothetical protein
LLQLVGVHRGRHDSALDDRVVARRDGLTLEAAHCDRLDIATVAESLGNLELQ